MILHWIADPELTQNVFSGHPPLPISHTSEKLLITCYK